MHSGRGPQEARLRRLHRLGGPGVVVLAALALIGAGGASAGAPYMRVSIFAHLGRNADGVVWTGRQFLYVINTQNTVYAAPPAGMPLTLFVSMKLLVEETRCILSPGSHGFPAGVIFCHAPDNEIYEINATGTQSTVFATLPARYPPSADGAFVFDDLGHFGYRLIAATGRSGAARPSGGAVYTIDASGHVQELAGYHGPGGADEAMIAPPNFGPLAGDLLLTVDAGASGGHLLAMSPNGTSRSLASFPGDGPNPILQIPSDVSPSGTPAPGIYISDDLTQDIYLVPASELAPFAGDLFVATEAEGHFFIVEPDGNGVRLIAVGNTLRHSNHGIEQAIYVR
jgi:hypothetical protein